MKVIYKNKFIYIPKCVITTCTICKMLFIYDLMADHIET